MSSEEKNAFGALVAFGFTIWFYGLPIWTKTATGAYGVEDGLQMWGRDVLWLMGGGIVITIVVMIVLHILLSILSGEHEPEMIKDERDHAISRRGSLVSLFGASAAFIAAVVSLAFGQSAIFALNCLLVGMTGGAMLSELVRIAHYRFGI